MANTQAVDDLLNALGLRQLGTQIRTVGIPTAEAMPMAGFGPGTIAELKDLLRRDPDRLMATAPALLGPSPTLADLARLLDAAEASLQMPDLSLAQFQANRTDEAFELPPAHQFEGYDTTEIPIFPKQRKFETQADAAAWALTATAALAYRLVHVKPDFPSHTTSSTGFVYPLVTQGGEATIALFSDWGTGYYHAQYVAKHIGRLAPGQAIHLGDVYYIGGSDEFADRFSPILERYITPRIPLFAMNANHEMDTHGIAYFQFLEEKRRAGGADGRVPQPQEGSYFALVSDHYQVIGIDTAFFKGGRYRDQTLVTWLQRNLAEGKSKKKVNILLSQNEPYLERPTKLLDTDLKSMVDQRLIDFWSWGDEHYCALYPPGPATPFGGSCIGHGGYPYDLLDREDFNRHLVKPLFAELEPRFPRELNLRPGVGNNGFCLLRLAAASLEIAYLDWRAQTRFSLTLPMAQGQLQWPGT